MDKEKNAKSIQNKLGTIKYNCSKDTHLILDEYKCSRCKEKVCTCVCPASVYNIDENTKKIVVQYENCLECGACRIACPYNAINWNYPSSGYGVIYKNS